MVPAYKNAASDTSAPLDILFVNLTNWPGNPVYPYAFVQVSALARRAGLSIRRWDGLGLDREQQLRCISDLVQQHQPRAVGFTVRQADSTVADEYLGEKSKTMPGWFPLEDTRAAIERVREISRGCPCHCAFCCEPLVKGRTLRLRDLDVVEAEVKNLLGFGLRYFWFVCSELTFTKKHVMELAERLIRINRVLEQPIYWRAYFLPVKFSKDEFRILLCSGLKF